MSKYKEAGVDVERGYKTVELIKKHVKSTFTKSVLNDIGGFGGLYDISEFKENNPVLVSGTDGVGTKLKLAFQMDKHDTIGIDCVAMCVNDVICAGAKPLFFLDYIASGKIYPEKIEKIVSGIAEGCRQAECSLIGGETAEMPGFYPDGEYDLVGFSVGIADKNKIINNNDIKAGNVLIGLQSSGVHSNGYSLVRKIFENHNLQEKVNERTLGSILIEPTKIYVKTIIKLIDNFKINGISHITGGGFVENIPRIIPEGLTAEIKLNTWDILPVFELLMSEGSMELHEILSIFNCGIGMVLAVNKDDSEDILEFIRDNTSDKGYVIGNIREESKKGEKICFK